MAENASPAPRSPGAARFAPALLCALLGGAGVYQLLSSGGLVGLLLAGFLLLGARVLLRPRPRDLARVIRRALALAAAVLLLFAALLAVWESAEVVVLHYRDDRGQPLRARLWVVDLDGTPSVATGSGKKRVEWIRAEPEVELTRGGRTECRRAVVVAASEAAEDAGRAARRAFEEKYGLRLYAARVLAFALGAPPDEEPVLIRLEPCPPANPA